MAETCAKMFDTRAKLLFCLLNLLMFLLLLSHWILKSLMFHAKQEEVISFDVLTKQSWDVHTWWKSKSKQSLAVVSLPLQWSFWPEETTAHRVMKGIPFLSKNGAYKNDGWDHKAEPIRITLYWVPPAPPLTPQDVCASKKRLYDVISNHWHFYLVWFCTTNNFPFVEPLWSKHFISSSQSNFSFFKQGR